MPRRRKPARLFQRKDDGAWLILDGGQQIRTGFGDGFHQGAEEALSTYIANKKRQDNRVCDPSEITIGEILVHYGEAKVKTVRDKDRLLYGIQALSPYWGDLRVSEINVEVVSRIWWKFSGGVLRAWGFGPDQAARSRLIGEMV